MSELNVRVEELSPVVRRLQIEVPADRVTQVTDVVYVRLSRTAKLKGYRQGHVPRRVLEKHFSEQVKDEVAREVMRETFPEALDTTQLVPVAEPTIEPEALTLGAAFHYAARIEVRPDVKLVQYKELEVAVPEVTVTDEAVSQRLEELREAGATLDPIEGRDDAQTGDHADVTYSVAVEGQPLPQRNNTGLVEVRPGSFLDGHGEKLAGMKIGETRDFTEVFDAEADPKLAGKTAMIKATLNGLKKRQLPALDDEFAKDQEVETLDALKAKVRQELEQEAKARLDGLKRGAVIEALIEKNPVEVPPALVDMAASRIAYQFLENVLRSGLKFDMDSPLIERIKKDAIAPATTEVKTLLLLDAVCKAENIVSTPEEIEQRIKDIAARERQPVAKVAARYQKPDARASLGIAARNDRAIELLVSQAKISIKPPEPEAAENAPAPENASPAT